MKCDCGLIVLDEKGLEEGSRIECPMCYKKYVFEDGSLKPELSPGQVFLNGLNGYVHRNKGILCYTYSLGLVIVAILVYIANTKSVGLRKPGAAEIILFAVLVVVIFIDFFVLKMFLGMRKRKKKNEV